MRIGAFTNAGAPCMNYMYSTLELLVNMRSGVIDAGMDTFSNFSPPIASLGVPLDWLVNAPPVKN